MDNGTFILPDFAIFLQLNVKLGKTQLTYIYGLAKTMQEPKFHISNSKNKDLPYNGTFILPDYINFMVKIYKVKLGNKPTHLFLQAR